MKKVLFKNTKSDTVWGNKYETVIKIEKDKVKKWEKVFFRKKIIISLGKHGGYNINQCNCFYKMQLSRLFYLHLSYNEQFSQMINAPKILEMVTNIAIQVTKNGTASFCKIF